MSQVTGHVTRAVEGCAGRSTACCKPYGCQPGKCLVDECRGLLLFMQPPDLARSSHCASVLASQGTQLEVNSLIPLQVFLSQLNITPGHK